jgi:hypothetical protein
MKQKQTKERRFVYIQCKVPRGWRSLKFRDAGGTGLWHPSYLGARPHPRVPAHDSAAIRDRGAGYGSQRSEEADEERRGLWRWSSRPRVGIPACP